jgi:hypothetical protein
MIEGDRYFLSPRIQKHAARLHRRRARFRHQVFSSVELAEAARRSLHEEGDLAQLRRFAVDSPLEGDGFEPSVPRQVFWQPRRSPRNSPSAI